MSWSESVRRALEPLKVEFEGTRAGNLLVKPIQPSNFTLIIFVRRMQYSLDRKLEMVGILNVENDRLGVLDRSELLKRMLAESVELEAKGFLSKNLKVRRWSALDALTKVIHVSEGSGLLHVLKNEETRGRIEKGGFELVEVFPRLVPEEFLEYCLLVSDKGAVVDSVVKNYIASPQSLSWVIRACLLYGAWRESKIRESYLAIVDLAKKIDVFTSVKLLS